MLVAELLHNAVVHPAMELALLAHDVTAAWAFPAEPPLKPHP
jgi:hypothetical protein